MNGRLPPLAGLAERILARLLALDSDALAALAALEPDLLAVEVAGTPWAVGLAPHAGGLALVPPEAPRAGVRGDLLGLLAWFGRDDAAHVTLNGDVAYARALAAVLRESRPDLEELLARALGDVPAHTLGNAVREVRTHTGRTRDDLLASIGEYLQHERRLLPSREAAAAFEADLAALGDGLAGLEVRLDALLARGGR